MEKKILSYVVVTAENSQELSEKVAGHIVQGWQPFGNHQITVIPAQSQYFSQRFLWSQPVVKYADN